MRSIWAPISYIESVFYLITRHYGTSYHVSRHCCLSIMAGFDIMMGSDDSFPATGIHHSLPLPPSHPNSMKLIQ